jgi:hypothetical protein
MEQRMPNNDALANLKPLIAPAAISWWPPAPGWWILGAILLVALVGLAVWAWKRWCHYRDTRYQREALELLSTVTEQEPEKQLQEVAAILRRAAICAWGREHAGTQNWNQIINMPRTRDGKKIPPALDENSLQLLTDHLYRQEIPSAVAMQNLRTQASVWLKTLPAVEH